MATTYKIGIVLDDTLDSSDGVQQHVLLLGYWLNKQGHDVHYLVGNTARTDILNTHSFTRNVRVKFNRNVLSVPLPASSRKIYNTLVQNQFDILHVQMPHSPMFAARVVALAPATTAIVGTFHIAPFSRFETAASQLLGFWLKPNMKYFDEIISVSPAAAELAAKAFRQKSTIIPNAIDITNFKSKPYKQKKPLIVFVGRLVPRKGAEHLIQALARMHELYPGMVFEARICGQGRDLAKLQRLVRRRGLSELVVFEGFVSEDKKKRLLSTARVAVFPSIGGESFGIVLLEAMAAGAHVVLAGNNPGYAGVLENDRAALFDPADHSVLADKLAALLSDDILADELHARQQALVKRYDIGVVGSQIVAVYKRAINKHKLF